MRDCRRKCKSMIQSMMIYIRMTFDVPTVSSQHDIWMILRNFAQALPRGCISVRSNTSTSTTLARFSWKPSTVSVQWHLCASLCHRFVSSSDNFNWAWPKNDTGSVSAGELSPRLKSNVTKIKWNKSDICFDAMFNLRFGKHEDQTNENDWKRGGARQNNMQGNMMVIVVVVVMMMMMTTMVVSPQIVWTKKNRSKNTCPGSRLAISRARFQYEWSTSCSCNMRWTATWQCIQSGNIQIISAGVPSQNHFHCSVQKQFSPTVSRCWTEWRSSEPQATYSYCVNMLGCSTTCPFHQLGCSLHSLAWSTWTNAFRSLGCVSEWSSWTGTGLRWDFQQLVLRWPADDDKSHVKILLDCTWKVLVWSRWILPWKQVFINATKFAQASSGVDGSSPLPFANCYGWKMLENWSVRQLESKQCNFAGGIAIVQAVAWQAIQHSTVFSNSKS